MEQKLLSGRYISTVIIVLTYAICAFIGTIPPEFIQQITLMCLSCYFVMKRDDKNTK